MLFAFWFVAWWRSGLAILMDPRTFLHEAGGCVNPDLSSRVSALGVRLLGPNTSLFSFTRFRSPYHCPLSSGPKAHVGPQEKK